MPGCLVMMDTVCEHPAGWRKVHAEVPIEGESVRLEIVTFSGRDAAFEKMEKVLNGMGFYGEKVRVY